MSGDRQSEDDQLAGGVREGGGLGIRNRTQERYIQGKMQRGKQVAETLG